MSPHEAGRSCGTAAHPSLRACLPTVLLQLVALVSAASASGQVVRVVIAGEEEGIPVAAAPVLLLDEEGVALDSVTTDAAGRVTVRAPSPGRYYLNVLPPDYLSYTHGIDIDADGIEGDTVRIPLRSRAASRIMGEVISREGAFQVPLDELCGEELRPWEAGVLVGVVRDRAGMEPLPGALVRVEPREPALAGPPDAGASDPPDAGATVPARIAAEASGAFWFCNVPAGDIDVVAVADGFRPDTFTAAIRAGSISWYDALLRRVRPERP